MGANAATKAYRIVNNVYSILAIELITASQALAFRRPLKTSPYLERMINTFRKQVPFIEEDRVLHDDIQKAEKFVREFVLE
jgi:histidine ammonia-lyase